MNIKKLMEKDLPQIPYEVADELLVNKITSTTFENKNDICLRCKEEMFKAKLKGDAVGTVVYLTNKKNGIFEAEKNSAVSCYVCPKCGYIELNADSVKNLI